MTTKTKSERLAELLTDANHKLTYGECEIVAAHIKAQAKALEAAREALEINRVMAKDAEGNYTREVTPKIITNALNLIKEVQ